MSGLSLKQVSKAYGATIAVSRGDLDIAPGEIHILIGANGSGKSTLCKIVAGSIRPDTGDVLIGGKPATVSGPQASRALGVGIFYQELSLSPGRTVAENISLADLPGTAGLFVDRKTVSDRAEHYMGLFDGVTGEGFSKDAPVSALRADQRQLVEIMKTLASEGQVLIFDEPTSALDRQQVERFFRILRQLKEQGRSIVFISHRMDEIFEIGDRVTIIRDGETIATSSLADTNPEEVVRQMVGISLETTEAKTNRTSEDKARKPVLSAKGLSGDGFKDISLDLLPGEILGLGGLHGQGQSALLQALFGLAPIAEGEILLKGEGFIPGQPRHAIRQGLAYISGDRRQDGILQERPILENASPVHAFRNRLILANPGPLKEAVRPALEALKTKFARFSSPIGSLSGGNQQKVVIARWLTEKPDILLLNDPSKGIDLTAKKDLFSLIRSLAEEGMSIILYSSEDSELLSHADRILVFNNGAITRELSGEDCTRYNLYQAAYEAA